VRRNLIALACALCVALAASGAARAQSLERIFSAGNEAYFRGDFGAAVQQYERLVAAGVHDPDVYFNLATARARLGQLGHAVLYFERCLWLRAGDELAEQGLTAARGALGKRRADREGEATLKTRPPLADALVARVSADALGWSLLVLDLLFFAALFARSRARRDGVHLGLTIAAPLLALLGLTAAAGLAFKTQVWAEGDAAIVLRDGSELREGPDPRAQVRARAHEGQDARVLRREGAFARVQLSRGERGWISSKDIARIRPN
jgi:tetratricopeptide (TPR) repeat protein